MIFKSFQHRSAGWRHKTARWRARVQFPFGVTPRRRSGSSRRGLFPSSGVKHAAGTQRRALYPSINREARQQRSTGCEGGGSYVRPFDSEAFKREIRSVKCTNHWQGVRESQIEPGIRNRVVIPRREITRIAGDCSRAEEREKERERERIQADL